MLARGKISWSAEVISEVLHFKCSVITAECRNANYKTQDNTTTATSKLTSAYIFKPTLITFFCFFIYDLWLVNILQGNKNKVKIEFLCMSYWCIMYIQQHQSIHSVLQHTAYHTTLLVIETLTSDIPGRKCFMVFDFHIYQYT